MEFNKFKVKYEKKKVLEFPHNVDSYPLVSVCVQTYQHAAYIKDCLEGILMQETNFSFEILLGEDASNDGTRGICKDYAKKYPDKIRLFLHHRENNIKIKGRPTGRFNFIYNCFSASGKYIAICEGDDYWTDPLKLQKQVDFLEANPTYGVCSHNVTEYNGFIHKSKVIPGISENTEFTFQQYILSNLTATCSLVLRKKYFEGFPNRMLKSPFGDLSLVMHILDSSNQKMKVFADNMGVYRLQIGGVHGKFRENNYGLVKAFSQHLDFNRIAFKEYGSCKINRKIFYQKYIETYRNLSRLFLMQKKYKSYFMSKIKGKYFQIRKNIRFW